MKYCDNILMLRPEGAGNWTTFIFSSSISSNIISINTGGLFMCSENSRSNIYPFDIGTNGKLKIIGVDEG